MSASADKAGGEGVARRYPGLRGRPVFVILVLVAIAYAFLAGLRTVTDYDLAWQMATGRWVAQHRHIPSTEVFSYTAAGQPWVYPVGAGLIFYATYLIGSFALLSWLGALVCAGTAALLPRRGSAATAGLVVFAIPLIAARTTPRAEMFSVLLFAVGLSLLWQYYQGRGASLWLLPMLMILWVNLHLGFVAGIALLGGYVVVEALGLIWPEERSARTDRLKRFAPWALATLAATLINPWGWNLYRALLQQQAVMGAHAQSISEWAATPLNWVNFSSSISLRSADGAFFLLVAVVLMAVPLAVWRRELGAAALLLGVLALGTRHARLQVYFALVVVIVGGAVLESAYSAWREKLGDSRLRAILTGGATAAVVLLAGVRSADVVTNRTYLQGTTEASFGAGLSWWFPESGAAFIKRENLPGQVFNDYNEGGYLTWRLGPKYPDYIDGRAIPFGPGLLARSGQLLATAPEAPEWQQEAERYNINVILVPLGRYDAVQFFPALRQFCFSQVWRPVYLDEVSAVFVRRRPETEELLSRFAVDCATAPLPNRPVDGGARAFNQWANAAAVLHALGRDGEAFAATDQAVRIFPDCAFVHFLRGTLLEQGGNSPAAEQEYRTAAELQPSAVAPWATLAAFYRQHGELPQAVAAGEHAAALSPRPWPILLELGYSYAALHRPQKALQAFDRAVNSLPSQPSMAVDESFFARVARGRALCWGVLGNLPRAIQFEEEAVRLMPMSSGQWLELASLYESAGRFPEAQAARLRAADLANGIQPVSRQQ